MRIVRISLVLLALVALLIVGGCSALPRILHALNPRVVYRIPDAGKTLYLTLDDGPSPATSSILSVLRQNHVPATFFVITEHIDPQEMSRILADGHQIAHHMKTSASIGHMTQEMFEREFLEADRALSTYSAVKLFRPPGGSISNEQALFVAKNGYTPVVGTVFPLDHWLQDEWKIETLAKALAIDGGIIILHDTGTRGARTAAVLNELIPYFKSKGYEFRLLPATMRGPGA